MNYLTSGNDAVDRIGMMNLTGNIIPQIWYKTVVNKAGKPRYLSIAILADIVYWYRPTEIRDERSGQIIGWKKKFQGEMLQRNYESISAQFGEGEKTVTRAIVTLEEIGVIKRHRKNIQLKSGLIVNNVLFLELIPERLYEITFPTVDMMAEDEKSTEWTNLSRGLDKSVQGVGQICPEGWTNLSEGSDKNVQGAGQICPKGRTNLSGGQDKSVQTNTENTLENTIENIMEISSINLSRETAEKQPDQMDTIEAYSEIIRENIAYDIHMNCDTYIDKEIFHELYEIICNVVSIPRETIRIGGEEYPYALVKAKFLKLNDQHLLYVMFCMKKTNTRIGNIRSYLTTALYFSPDTISSFYQQEVNHDLYGYDN